jgi:hypothetical protein
VFTAEEWDYLCRLNMWDYAHNYPGYLKRREHGEITMVCPGAAFNAPLLHSVAEIVDSADDFIIKTDYTLM